jgi:glycosyltransferase involved in cell wall biosynthesis
VILYTAAHGGFAASPVPLGGGAAVFEHLIEEWTRTLPFPFKTITPSILGTGAPTGRDLVRFGERDYARFSRAFEGAATAEILRHNPADTVVLSNDVSEGPDFSALRRRGFRVYTIYHVDVVAYVAEIYGRGLVRPETLVNWYPRLRRWLPDMARLIWEKQAASVWDSMGLIVPSEGMREVLLRCYPDCPPSKIHVVPWGAWDAASNEPPEDLRAEFEVPKDARVLLTLSRISPEKGQDLLLDALAEWERRPDFPAYPVWVFVCGEAAFMQGAGFLEKLRRKAAKLRKTRVIFPGYVTGARKRAFFKMADVYVFPSRHESYGLTLMEALAAGVPAVCLDHAGARAVMRPEFGAMVPAAGLREGIACVLNDDKAWPGMGGAARKFAETQRFSDRAAELAALLA